MCFLVAGDQFLLPCFPLSHLASTLHWHNRSSSTIYPSSKPSLTKPSFHSQNHPHCTFPPQHLSFHLLLLLPILTPNSPNPLHHPSFTPYPLHALSSILLDRHVHAPSPAYINFILIATRLLENFRREFVRAKWISFPIAWIRKDTWICRRPVSGGVR